ncbi:MAG TPA: hypothetical protein VEB86_10775 [Chryseosolibacter sp.]|nr:hypothetical protein [Chryseosolibacter sp.]
MELPFFSTTNLRKMPTGDPVTSGACEGTGSRVPEVSFVSNERQHSGYSHSSIRNLIISIREAFSAASRYARKSEI